jgi:ABC-type glycerol-3-phosphate transport system substrate-binding protein
MYLRKSVGIILLALVASGLLSAGCSKTQSTKADEPVEELTTFEEGTPEYEARALVEELTIVVDTNSDEPQQALSQVQRFVRSNQQRIEDNTEALEERYQRVPEEQRDIYARELAEFMAATTQAWRDALENIRDSSEQVADRIDRVLADVID